MYSSDDHGAQSSFPIFFRVTEKEKTDWKKMRSNGKKTSHKAKHFRIENLMNSKLILTFWHNLEICIAHHIIICSLRIHFQTWNWFSPTLNGKFTKRNKVIYFTKEVFSNHVYRSLHQNTYKISSILYYFDLLLMINILWVDSVTDIGS